MLGESGRGYGNYLTVLPDLALSSAAGVTLESAGMLFSAFGAGLVIVVALACFGRWVPRDELVAWTAVASILPAQWVRSQPWYWVPALALAAVSMPQSRRHRVAMPLLTAFVLLVRYAL